MTVIINRLNGAINDGFNNTVSPEIIGSIVNVRMLSEYENRSKHKRSDITLEKLLSDFNANKGIL